VFCFLHLSFAISRYREPTKRIAHALFLLFFSRSIINTTDSKWYNKPLTLLFSFLQSYRFFSLPFFLFFFSHHHYRHQPIEQIIRFSTTTTTHILSLSLPSCFTSANCLLTNSEKHLSSSLTIAWHQLLNNPFQLDLSYVLCTDLK
jgi:hypothetical protein